MDFLTFWKFVHVFKKYVKAKYYTWVLKVYENSLLKL